MLIVFSGVTLCTSCFQSADGLYWKYVSGSIAGSYCLPFLTSTIACQWYDQVTPILFDKFDPGNFPCDPAFKYVFDSPVPVGQMFYQSQNISSQTRFMFNQGALFPPSNTPGVGNLKIFHFFDSHVYPDDCDGGTFDNINTICGDQGPGDGSAAAIGGTVTITADGC